MKGLQSEGVAIYLGFYISIVAGTGRRLTAKEIRPSRQTNLNLIWLTSIPIKIALYISSWQQIGIFFCSLTVDLWYRS